MTDYSVNTRGSRETELVGEALGRCVRPGDVVVLSGDLGAGKTRLVKGVAAAMGVTEPVTSPTFNILLVYRGRIPLYHFDLYRFESAGQLDDVDYWGVLEADGVSCIEWGDRFPDDMPADYLRVVIHTTADEERRLEVSSAGERGAALAEEWSRELRAVPDVRIEVGS